LDALPGGMRLGGSRRRRRGFRFAVVVHSFILTVWPWASTAPYCEQPHAPKVLIRPRALSGVLSFREGKPKLKLGGTSQ
jgi:hypothetical protein